MHAWRQAGAAARLEDVDRFVGREHAILAEDVAVLRERFVGDTRDHLFDDAGDVFAAARAIFDRDFVRTHERWHEVDGVRLVQRANRVQLAQLRFDRQPVAALRLADRRPAGEHLVEPGARGVDELLFARRARGGDRLHDAAAIGRDRRVAFARKAPPQLGAPIARVDDVRVWIDEARDDGAAARVDARRILRHGHTVLERRCLADVRDASLERRDDAVVQRRDFALRQAPAGRRPRAGGNQVSVFDEEVRLEHADLA